MRQQDRSGEFNYTEWTIEFANYIDCEIDPNNNEMNSKLDEMICKVVNKVILLYGHKTGEFWIQDIYLKMLPEKTIQYFSDNIMFREVLRHGSGVYRVSAEEDTVDLHEINVEIPFYSILLQDAQSYLVAERYREAILSLNSGFENYICVRVCPFIVETSKGEYEEGFLFENTKV